MAMTTKTILTSSLLLAISLLQISTSARILTHEQADSTDVLGYHKGSLLYGHISINLIWYGKFTPSQKAIISDFITSLSSTTTTKPQPEPSVATWWASISKYYHLANKNTPTLSFSLGKQLTHDTYSLGNSLTNEHLLHLAATGQQLNAINVVLTSSDVAVDGFCSSRCGTHGSSYSTASHATRPSKFAYIWVGNSGTQCPGQCAWPFHQPMYGPQGPPLVAPNNDVGLDGMVINLASLLAGTATNPFGNGFYQGPKEAPLEVGSACTGVYGKGAYPGYAGDLMVDTSTGGSYNANGANGRKYLVPALFDPSTSTCSTFL